MGKKTEKKTKKDDEDIKEDIRDIRNRIDKIMGDTHNISRILTLRDRETIKQDLITLIGSSTKKAAILVLTSDYIERSELAQKIAVDKRNLNKFLNPILEKGYVSETKDGRKKLFKRSEIIHLIGFEKIDEFSKLIKAWEDGNIDS
jgi:hypothetical protein